MSPARQRPRRAEDDLRRRLDEQATVIAALTERLANLEAEQTESRRVASAGQREMLRRLEELRPGPWGPPPSASSAPSRVAPPSGSAAPPAGDDLPTGVPVEAAAAVPRARRRPAATPVHANVRT